jgi:2'-5' RNA ligase
MEALNYAPHITLAIYDDIGIPKLVDVFDSAVEDLDRMTVRFDRLDYFEAPHAIILWAAPVLPKKVYSVYDHIHSKIDTNLCRPHYRPGVWVPHCSLALSVDLAKKEEAIAMARQSIESIEVIFDVADCVSFLPVEVLHEKALRSVA